MAQATSEKTATVYAIKVRAKGAARWSFLSGNGITHLRIHATQFSNENRAKEVLEQVERDNYQYEFRVVVFAAETGK